MNNKQKILEALASDPDVWWQPKDFTSITAGLGYQEVCICLPKLFEEGKVHRGALLNPNGHGWHAKTYYRLASDNKGEGWLLEETESENLEEVDRIAGKTVKDFWVEVKQKRKDFRTK